MLALKDNQPETCAAVAAGRLVVDHLNWQETLDKGHSRLKRRTCQVIHDVATVAWLQQHPAGEWVGLRTIVEVQATCQRGDRRHRETRYYLSSLDPAAGRLNDVIPRHRAIENELHWVLDVVFNEDRIWMGFAAENAGILRKLALSVLKQVPWTGSLTGKRQRAGWDDAYPAHVLGLPSSPTP